MLTWKGIKEIAQYIGMIVLATIIIATAFMIAIKLWIIMFGAITLTNCPGVGQ